MPRDPLSTLPIPSCAEARSVGVFVSQMLCEMEEAIGVDACRAFLARHAGRNIDIPTLPATTKDRELRPAIDWLRATFGFGCMAIPLGPASNAARNVWAIRNLNGEGRSLTSIAGTLDVSARTVQRHRARLRAHCPDITPRTSDRTPDR